MLEYLTPNKKRALVNLERVAKVTESRNGCNVTYDTGHKEFVSVDYDTLTNHIKRKGIQNDYEVHINGLGPDTILFDGPSGKRVSQ